VKLVVVSHPCARPENQEFFCDVERVSGWDLTIVTPQRWRSDYGWHRAERHPELRGELIPLPVLLAGNIPGHVYRRRLSSLLKDRRPDSVYVHHEPYALATIQTCFSARALGEVPVGFYSAQNILKRHRWPIGAGERWVFRRAGFALPISSSVAEVLRAKGYEGRLEVLPLGIRPGGRHASGKGDPASSEADRDTFTLGYVGRLSKEKGVDLIIDALGRLPGPRFRAVIVGDGPEREALQRRASELGLAGRVEWRGYVPHADQTEKYRGVDLVLVPSRTMPNWKEQFGRVVLEALSSGKPVLTSDSGELPNLVSQTGGGTTFPEDDLTTLVSRIEQVDAEPESLARWASRGHEAVERLFDSQVLAGRFCEAVAAAGQAEAPAPSGTG
jgi:glycosyltransferase involved in cell wall biosynthesis